MKQSQRSPLRPIPYIFFLLLLLASCGDTSADTESASVTEPSDVTPAVTEPAEPTNEDLVRSQIGTQDFGGETFRVVSRDAGGAFYGTAGEQENELYFAEETGDVLYDAIYRRNVITEELLNIEIEPVWSGSLTEDVTKVIEKNVMAGDDFADAIIHRLDFTMNIAAEGYLVNFYDIPTVNLSNNWWDQTIISNFTMFGDKLYALCGDIVFYDDYAVQAIFGNTRIMSELDMEIPYQAVRDGTWTFDMFSKMALEAEADLNGDGKIERETDRVGYINHSDAVLHTVYAFGERLSKTEEDGTITVNYGNDDIIAAVDTISAFIAALSDPVGDGCPALVRAGNVLFFPEMIGGLSGMREMQDDYCVLPLPKADESQKTYTAYVSNGWTTCYSIPMTAPNTSRIGTVLEVMSAVSADTVTPALYDIMLNEKFVRDAESQEMLSYVWASKAYDLAGDLAWASDLRSVYQSIASTGKNNYTSSMEKKLKTINKKLDNFLAAFSET